MTSPTTVKEVLIAARDLISDPKRWTQKASARNWAGGVVSPLSAQAKCWCSLGALVRFGGGINSAAYEALRSVIGKGVSVGEFNDSSPHEDVLAAFDIAICLES